MAKETYIEGKRDLDSAAPEDALIEALELRHQLRQGPVPDDVELRLPCFALRGEKKRIDIGFRFRFRFSFGFRFRFSFGSGVARCPTPAR